MGIIRITMPPKRSDKSPSASRGAHAAGVGDYDGDEKYESKSLVVPAADGQLRELISQRMHSTAELHNLIQFMSTPTYVRAVGDSTTNIVNRHIGKCCMIPDGAIGRFFELYEAARLAGSYMMIYEKQLEYSGIMLELDIYQTTSEMRLSPEMIGDIVVEIATIVADKIEFTREFATHIVVTRKPHIEFKQDKDCYKFGIHILIPGVRIQRGAKRLIVNALAESAELATILAPIPAPVGVDRKSFVDTASAHVCVFFLGSSTKPGAPAYGLHRIFRVTFRAPSRDRSKVPKVEEVTTRLLARSDINWSHELSLNWVVDTREPLIAKENFQVKSAFASTAASYETTAGSMQIDPLDPVHGKLSLLAMSDAEIPYIRKILDILSPMRYNGYEHWFRVVCALAHTAENYKLLAEYFSRKSAKFDAAEFDSVWNEARRRRGRSNQVSMGTIYYMASIDNPAAYAEIRKSNHHDLLYEMIFRKTAEGILNHANIASLLKAMIGPKYVFCREGGAKMGTWFEFITEADKPVDGELYKWRSYGPAELPSSLITYITRTLPNLFDDAYVRLHACIKKSKDGAEFYAHVLQNFKRTVVNVGNMPMIRGVLDVLSAELSDRSFVAKLDARGDLLGVRNGIVQLGTTPILHVGSTDLFVSKYTNVEYVPFDPRNKYVREVLIAFRAGYPDDEPDKAEFMMYCHALGLDNHVKPSLFIIEHGSGSNGKSARSEHIKETLGSQYCVKLDINLFVDNPRRSAETASPALLTLKDARMAYTSEPRQGMTLDEGKLKEAVGRDTIVARGLFRDPVSFRPRNLYFCSTNWPLRILGNDHGIWRRLVYVRSSVRFVAEPHAKNDRKVDERWIRDKIHQDEYKSALLSILVWYYARLQKRYGGELSRVPKPTIDRETADYRNNQDSMHLFMSQYLVEHEDGSDYEPPQPVTTVIREFIAWAKLRNDITWRGDINAMLENSVLHSYMIKSRESHILVKCRVMSISEEKPTEGERLVVAARRAARLDEVKQISETPQQYYERICREFDEEARSADTKMAAGAPAVAGELAPADRKQEISIETIRQTYDLIVGREQQQHPDERDRVIRERGDIAKNTAIIEGRGQPKRRDDSDDE